MALDVAVVTPDSGCCLMKPLAWTSTSALRLTTFVTTEIVWTFRALTTVNVMRVSRSNLESAQTLTNVTLKSMSVGRTDSVRILKVEKLSAFLRFLIRLFQIASSCLGSYQCNCEPGFVFDDGTCIDLDECGIDEGRCEHGRCENQVPGFICHCDKGFVNNNNQCVDVNECEDGQVNPCGKGRCENRIGDYHCICHLGFEVEKNCLLFIFWLSLTYLLTWQFSSSTVSVLTLTSVWGIRKHVEHQGIVSIWRAATDVSVIGVFNCRTTWMLIHALILTSAWMSLAVEVIVSTMLAHMNVNAPQDFIKYKKVTVAYLIESLFVNDYNSQKTI